LAHRIGIHVRVSFHAVDARAALFFPHKKDGKTTNEKASAAAGAAHEQRNKPDLQHKAIHEALRRTAGHIQVSRDFIGSIKSTRLP
jgi:hypothetical protein